MGECVKRYVLLEGYAYDFNLYQPFSCYFLCPDNIVCLLCLLHISLRTNFIMEANTMNPDQTAPLEFECNIGHQSI